MSGLARMSRLHFRDAVESRRPDVLPTLPAAVMEVQLVQLPLLLRTLHTTVAKREADCMLLGGS